MTLGSLFDGTGGFPLAGLLAGITPVWSSEIVDFCNAVTAARIPSMQHLGDITEIDGRTITPVDIITFGSPCQDLSCAGKQAGIRKGTRSNFFFEAVRIITEMFDATDGKYPRYIVWENVPGALNSNKGDDFHAVIEALCGIVDPVCDVPRPEKWSKIGAIMGDGFSLAWKILDAKYSGVPQRRKRIYLVGGLNGGGAPEILLKPSGVQWDTEKSREAWKNVTANTQGCADEDSPSWLGITPPNRIECINNSGNGIEAEYIVVENHPADSRIKICEDGIVQTLSARMGTGGVTSH